MALNIAGLEADLLNIFNGSTASPSAGDAGINWGTAYSTFAQTGMAGAVPPVVLPIVTTALQFSLGTAFSTFPGVPATVAAQVAAALDTYWAAVTFAAQIAPPAPLGSVVFIANFATTINSIGGTWSAKATAVGLEMLAYTALVQVTFAGPVTVLVT